MRQTTNNNNNNNNKTGRKGVGNEDLDVKPGEDKSVGKRGVPQLDVQGLKLEQPQDPEEGHRRRRWIPRRRHRRRHRIVRTRHGKRHRITHEAPLDPKETEDAVGSRRGDTGGAIGS